MVKLYIGMLPIGVRVEYGITLRYSVDASEYCLGANSNDKDTSCAVYSDLYPRCNVGHGVSALVQKTVSGCMSKSLNNKFVLDFFNMVFVSFEMSSKINFLNFFFAVRSPRPLLLGINSSAFVYVKSMS